MIARSIGFMMSSAPSMPSGNSVLDEAISAALHPERMDSSYEPADDKWPILVRLAVIMGLSAFLWACIIWGVMALIS